MNGISDDGNTLVKDRIRKALSAALRSKGLVETTDHPDLAVGYLGGARSRTEIEGMPPYAPEMGPYWYGGWWGPGYAEWWTRTYEEGTLVIDLVDRTTQRRLVCAYAAAIKVSTPLTSRERSSAAVEKAFKYYPPHP